MLQMNKLFSSSFRGTPTAPDGTHRRLSAWTSQWLVLVDVKERHVFDDVLRDWEHVVVVDTSQVGIINLFHVHAYKND